MVISQLTVNQTTQEEGLRLALHRHQSRRLRSQQRPHRVGPRGHSDVYQADRGRILRH